MIGRGLPTSVNVPRISIVKSNQPRGGCEGRRRGRGRSANSFGNAQLGTAPDYVAAATSEPHTRSRNVACHDQQPFVVRPAMPQIAGDDDLPPEQITILLVLSILQDQLHFALVVP